MRSKLAGVHFGRLRKLILRVAPDVVYPELVFKFNLVTSLLVTRRTIFCELRMTFVNCVCIGTQEIAAAVLEVLWFGSDQHAGDLNPTIGNRNVRYAPVLLMAAVVRLNGIFFRGRRGTGRACRT